MPKLLYYNAGQNPVNAYGHQSGNPNYLEDVAQYLATSQSHFGSMYENQQLADSLCAAQKKLDAAIWQYRDEKGIIVDPDKPDIRDGFCDKD